MALWGLVIFMLLGLLSRVSNAVLTEQVRLVGILIGQRILLRIIGQGVLPKDQSSVPSSAYRSSSV